MGLKCSRDQLEDTQLQRSGQGEEGHDLRSDRKSPRNEQDLGGEAGEEADGKAL